MLNIKYKKSIIVVLSIAIIAILGIIPSIIVRRPADSLLMNPEGSGGCVVYPSQYLKGDDVTTDDLDHFRSVDGNVIHWSGENGLETSIWFTRPSCGARKGNSVQMVLRYHSDTHKALNIIIRYWDGFAQWYYFTGDEDEYVSVLAPIPNYKYVDYIDFDTVLGVTDLKIDYLAACYPNVDLGGISPINLFLIKNIPDGPH